MKNVFTYRPPVQKSDIDSLGHVNNEVYLRWLIEAAMAHSSAVGFSLEKFIERGEAFVVRHHELDYMLPVFLEDKIRVETWTIPMEGPRAMRHYEIYNESNQKLILSGKTLWVYVHLQTGRPMKVPAEVIQAFADFKP